MEKVLSIIIPTYNKEKTLSKCLLSFLHHDWDHILEVFIVNDGSTDNSLKIAQEFQRTYPNIIQIIDKPNGNYGSTINAALPLAKGRYIKILDADDWFNKEGFHKFIISLKDIYSDLIITHFIYEYSTGEAAIVYYQNWEYNKCHTFEEISNNKKFMNMYMHAVTYRTDMLKKNSYKQTEKVSYTDNEWVFYPMFYVKTVLFLDILVYHYSVGVEGQTMTPDIYIRNIPYTQEFCKKMLRAYAEFIINNPKSKRKEYLFFRLKWAISPLYRIYLLFQSKEEFKSELLDDIDYSLKQTDLQLYKEIAKLSVGHIFHFHYITYWRRYRIRIPRFILQYWIKKGKIKTF